ncbi:helix-turn-helix transcriptional regulator [Mesosutterella sp. AGMB02718]|uniref:Helix-turn-helix transcriptional regulator n=1 Tax=Mesosutterella faecium TaxID=2925194 RepID=A0ABT7IS36_9BURK|nr:helix-turn-helix transcriptional regulator [Mesosutterella sp. AGMB02718]MDL2060092.1 helix-turn-helix transcriptional regulator [Mesosutterella sp. AGMB02718]
MRNRRVEEAIERLSERFRAISWRYAKTPLALPREKIQLWPGRADEDVMLCIYKGREYIEAFHRQDYFFFNFAFRGQYEALSERFDHRITIRENECYISQPFTGYAIQSRSETDTVIAGVLIQKIPFFRTYFHVLSANRRLFRFFLEPQTRRYSDEYIHLRFEDDFAVRRLLELMMVEYAEGRENAQSVLQSLTLALLMQIAREYEKTVRSRSGNPIPEQILLYIGSHLDTVTLSGLARHFGYHPNYLSALIPKEFGKTFSELLLEQRMERAEALLRGTALPVSEVAWMLGYKSPSHFYKAYRAFFHASPRGEKKEPSGGPRAPSDGLRTLPR